IAIATLIGRGGSGFSTPLESCERIKDFIPPPMLPNVAPMTGGGVVQFPSHFVFGVSTAAYQVEGNIENDWSEWERAGRLKQAHVRCGLGVDFWNRYLEDYGLARGVGCDAFRISIEWARVEPERGRFDEAALDGYRHRLLAMKAKGLRPVVTLHHFTHPSWFY